MTKIKATLNKTNDIITNLINKLDIANLGNWNTEKVEITKLLDYLKDKTKTKPTSVTDDIEIDLTEIEALETTLQNLTDENTRLTNENATLTTKTTEQTGIISNTTIPNLIASLSQYANKVADGELKTSLTQITTALTNLQKTQEEQAKKLEAKGNTNYWNIGTFIFAGISFLLLGYIAFFKDKQEKNKGIYE